MVPILLANPKIFYKIGVVVAVALIYLYCRPMAIPCLPCCEPNCSMTGTFTYCMKGTGSETSMCPAMKTTAKILKGIFKAIMAFIEVLKTVLKGIYKVMLNIYKGVAKIIEIIAKIVGIFLNFFSFDFNIIPECPIDFKVWKPDPCVAIKSVFDWLGTQFKLLLDKVLKPVIKKIGDFAPELKKALAPLINFVLDIINVVIMPLIYFVKNVVHLMYYLIVFLKNLFFADFGKYLYWKFLWKIHSIFPYVPIQFVPLIIASIITTQFVGGMIGVMKLTMVPINMTLSIQRIR